MKNRLFGSKVAKPIGLSYHSPPNKTRHENISQPFLRWAGGKRRLVKHLQRYLPREPIRCYWEPFLGAASLFFSVRPSKAILSDLNPELISCYEHVRDDPNLVYKYLRRHLNTSDRDYYYRIREKYNNSSFSAAQAARFIYLNRTCFNGIHRVNMLGEFNVPYGFKEPPPAPKLIDLIEAANVLNSATLYNLDFEKMFSRRKAKEGDFIYLDPPYPPLDPKTANFTHYTNGRFAWSDHVNLANMAVRLADNGCYVMISNSSVKEVKALYKSNRWNLIELPVVRLVAANGNRRLVRELIITNYTVLPAEGK